jgi:hypothetical protein
MNTKENQCQDTELCVVEALQQASRGRLANESTRHLMRREFLQKRVPAFVSGTAKRSEKPQGAETEAA